MSNYRKSLKVYEPPECFKDGFDSFINSLKPRSLKEATIYKYRRDCTFMLTSFFENGITQWCDIMLLSTVITSRVSAHPQDYFSLIWLKSG